MARDGTGSFIIEEVLVVILIGSKLLVLAGSRQSSLEAFSTKSFDRVKLRFCITLCNSNSYLIADLIVLEMLVLYGLEWKLVASSLNKCL